MAPPFPHAFNTSTGHNAYFPILALVALVVRVPGHQQLFGGNDGSSSILPASADDISKYSSGAEEHGNGIW